MRVITKIVWVVQLVIQAIGNDLHIWIPYQFTFQRLFKKKKTTKNKPNSINLLMKWFYSIATLPRVTTSSGFLTWKLFVFGTSSAEWHGIRLILWVKKWFLFFSIIRLHHSFVPEWNASILFLWRLNRPKFRKTVQFVSSAHSNTTEKWTQIVHDLMSDKWWMMSLAKNQAKHQTALKKSSFIVIIHCRMSFLTELAQTSPLIHVFIFSLFCQG